jgi:opacity protein-like surface antigen
MWRGVVVPLRRESITHGDRSIMMKRTVTAAALAAVLAAPAFAQSPTPSSPPSPAATSSSSTSAPSASGTFIDKQQASDWRGSKVIGTTVYGPDNASIGEVNDVLIGSDGKIRAAVIGVGGFLGVGQKSVAIPFEQLNISGKPDSSSIQKITVAFSKDQLKNAPTFAFNDAAGSQTTGSGAPSGLNGLSGSSGGKPATGPGTMK